MPYLKIQTNIGIKDKNEMMLEATALLSNILMKPEQYIMVALESGSDMVFAGTDEPLAFLELKSIGLPENETAALSAEICEFIQKSLGISKERIYIEFSDVKRHLFGWNGKTFERN